MTSGDTAAPTTEPRADRFSSVLVGALGLAIAVAVIDSFPIGVVYDDAMYVILARSLASGRGYSYLNLPGAPAASHFPPGYPAVLAVVSWIAPAFPRNITVFKALNAIFFAVGAMLIARFARRLLNWRRWATGVGVASAVSIPLLVLSTLVLSEPLFLVLLLALLPALESFVEAPATTRRALLLGVAIAGCTLVRTHGIVLLPAVLLMLAARRRWRDAGLVSAAAIVCLLPWQIWTTIHAGKLPEPLLGNYESYAGWWLRGLRATGPEMIPKTLSATTGDSWTMFAALFSPTPGTLSHTVTFVALASLTGIGVMSLRRRAPVTLLFLAGYIAIVLLWPFPPVRFVWAIWPLLLLVLAAGARAAVEQARGLGGALRIAALAGFAWIAVGYGLYEVRGVRGRWWSSLARANAPRIESGVEWAAANTTPQDLLAGEDEGALFLYTDRLAVPVFSFTTSQYLRSISAEENAAAGLRPILDAYPVRTVIVGNRKTVEAADVLVTSSPPRLAIRADFPGGVAYTVIRR